MIKIEVINIQKSYDSNIILDKVSLTIYPKKVNVILGPSGCGKSTLLSIIAGLDDSFKGKVKGINLKRISYVFQEDCLLEWSTVEENILYALSGNIERRDFLDYSHILGLFDYRNYKPHQLSGGLRQRVNLLRAFLSSSSLLLMDEPFKSLDVQSKEEAVNLFLRVQKERELTVLLVTHSLDEALQLGNYIHMLSNKPTKLLNTSVNPYFNLKEIGYKKNRELFLDEIKKLLQ